MQRTNVAVLTQSHAAIAAKKRKKNGQVKEVIFDDDARREYLTGFHKRKTAKKEEARRRAKLREKQERQELRREHRRALAERAARNAAEVETAYGAVIGHEEETGGNASDTDEIGEEYEGEEQLATVTVVEDFDPASLLHGPLQNSRGHSSDLASSPSASRVKERIQHETVVIQRKSTKNRKPKYQTKATRAAERAKQKARHTAKAERAGGKASRIRKKRQR
ncbi:hypothetical protein SCLCIDRAFT_1208616 [Scleroderma citrinum Foug A]|uniref:Ribosomal RNA-processing protein 17 n=1 Tax=Scleroderma citrinum Foug A TaxID=1036808 RepID=A0A0C3EMY4_9AGAM|nr:hypothetical protein SCLCIDRAFT_1208616 [Scleroderma citrinum Foug A]